MQSKLAAIGEVPAHWHVGPLRDVLDLITYGFTNPMPDATEGPWKLTAKDIVDGRIRYDTARHTTETAFNTLLTDKSRPRIGDVLLTKDGSIGRVAVVDRDGLCINQSVALLRPNGRVLPHFLALLLRAPYYQSRMEGDSDGSTIKHIYITRVDKMEIALPPLAEQEHHLALLGTMDDRIDLLRQTNATLESIAQALFKSWFIDFDPVRAKTEGREPDGMDAAKAALFPAEFEESELGLIPKGWKVGQLDDVCENARVQAKPGHMAGDTPYIGLEHMPRKSIALGEAGTAEGLESGKFWFERNDILFGKLRPYFHKVGIAPVRGVCSTDILVIRPRNETGLGFTTMHLFSDELIAHTTRLSNGARMPRTSWHDVETYKIVLPKNDVVAAYNEAVQPMFERIHANIESARSLAATRDTLLPRIISGKLSLPEAEAQLEEAAE